MFQFYKNMTLESKLSSVIIKLMFFIFLGYWLTWKNNAVLPCFVAFVVSTVDQLTDYQKKYPRQ